MNWEIMWSMRDANVFVFVSCMTDWEEVHRMSLCHSSGALQFSNLCFCVSVVFFSALDGGRFVFVIRRLVIQQWAWQVVVGGIVL